MYCLYACIAGTFAGVAELADAQDLKSCGTYTPIRVRFPLPAYERIPHKLTAWAVACGGFLSGGERECYWG